MAMLWMETYMMYWSVRLGVMAISVFSLITLFVPSCILFYAMGVHNKDEHFWVHSLVEMFSVMVDHDIDTLMALFQIYFFSHMAASVLAFYGAWKIKKYFLLPMIFFELIRVIYCLICHVLFMTAYKNQFNLVLLISSTLAGGFVILFLAYNWATCVALYQIITLINSERYKSIYGDDPFKPLIPKTYNPLVTENVRVLITPDSRDIDVQKERNALLTAVNNNRLRPPAVISVLPANYIPNNNLNSHNHDAKWKISNWPTTKIETIKTPSPAAPRNNVYGHNYDVNYDNWQWSELAPAVSARKKKSIFMGSNWN